MSDDEFLVGTAPSKRRRTSPSSFECEELICRYLMSTSRDILTPVSRSGMELRAESCTEYLNAYRLALGVRSLANSGGTTDDKYSAAVKMLHVSVSPSVLPCREEEQSKVEKFLRAAIRNKGERRPLYISGMPGTGKTATVLAVIRRLVDEVGEAACEFIELNCLRLQSPADAYTVLWKGIAGQHLSARAALHRLSQHFDHLSSTSGDDDTVLVCLLDELDWLITNNENVVYNFFEWCSRKHSNLVVIGIANTMDLPERLSARALSRLGGQTLHRMVFKPYTHDQMHSILSERLKDLGIFDVRSLELIARKAAATAGDLRSALKICQRSIEICSNRSKNDENETSAVTLSDVNMAAAEYRENPLMLMTAQACLLDRILILGMCTQQRATGAAAMSFKDIANRASDVVQRCSRHCGDLIDVINEGSLLLSAVRSSINRMVDMGMLRKERPRRLQGIPCMELDMFVPVLLFSDAIAALRSAEDPIVKELWPEEF